METSLNCDSETLHIKSCGVWLVPHLMRNLWRGNKGWASNNLALAEEAGKAHSTRSWDSKCDFSLEGIENLALWGGPGSWLRAGDVQGKLELPCCARLYRGCWRPGIQSAALKRSGSAKQRKTDSLCHLTDKTETERTEEIHGKCKSWYCKMGCCFIKARRKIIQFGTHNN